MIHIKSKNEGQRNGWYQPRRQFKSMKSDDESERGDKDKREAINTKERGTKREAKATKERERERGDKDRRVRDKETERGEKRRNEERLWIVIIQGMPEANLFFFFFLKLDQAALSKLFLDDCFGD